MPAVVADHDAAGRSLWNGVEQVGAEASRGLANHQPVHPVGASAEQTAQPSRAKGQALAEAFEA